LIVSNADGSHYLSRENAFKDAVWGYGDETISDEDQAELVKMK